VRHGRLGYAGCNGRNELCGGSVIQDGELELVTQEQVLAACGEPTTRSEDGQWVYA